MAKPDQNHVDDYSFSDTKGVFPLIVLEEVESTSDALKHLCRAGDARHGLALAARSQTRGRGRHGREWFSLPGNIMMSVALQKAELEFHAQLSLVFGMAVCRYLRGLMQSPEQLVVKWPNDLLWQGRKAGGILLEAEGDFLVVGIGINLLESPAVMKDEAVSLQSSFMASAVAAAHYAPLRQAILEAYGIWGKHGFSPFHETWAEFAFRVGSEVRVRQGDDVLTGCYDGINADGALCLKTDKDRLCIAAGEVVLLEGNG
ncbi:biotin--[acetyl-CoA-carboxylase] ligase [bacterium]|nr:biotin--[acetyl-CoA-carboxylase] ligase [bacterium]